MKILRFWSLVRMYVIVRVFESRDVRRPRGYHRVFFKFNTTSRSSRQEEEEKERMRQNEIFLSTTFPVAARGSRSRLDKNYNNKRLINERSLAPLARVLSLRWSYRLLLSLRDASKQRNDSLWQLRSRNGCKLIRIIPADSCSFGCDSQLDIFFPPDSCCFRRELFPRERERSEESGKKKAGGNDAISKELGRRETTVFLAITGNRFRFFLFFLFFFLSSLPPEEGMSIRFY